MALTAVVSAFYFFIQATFEVGSAQIPYYRAAFFSFVIIIICIESRVRMGYRLPRGLLFGIHLSCSIPFFLLLGIIAFFPVAIWLIYIADILSIIMITTGIILFTRGLRNELSF